MSFSPLFVPLFRYEFFSTFLCLTSVMSFSLLFHASLEV
jgi:hypothetical protein